MVILWDLNTLAWMQIEGSRENNLRTIDMLCILLDCLFLRFM